MSRTVSSAKELAVVTGASSGLGSHFVSLFKQLGFIVIAGSSSVSENNRLSFPLQTSQTVHLDFDAIESVQNFVADLTQASSEMPLKFLINNASHDGPRDTAFPKEILSVAYLKEWQKSLTVTSWGTAVLCDTLGGLMKNSAPAQILNISAASAVSEQTENLPVLSSKASVSQITRMFAKQLQGSVAVNCLAPGFVLTERVRERKALFPQKFKQLDEKHTSNTYLEVDDFNPIIEMLLANTTVAMTGQTLIVDGGRFA